MKDIPCIYFCTSFCQGLWGRVLSPYPGGGSRLSRLNGVFNEERDIVARCRSGWRTTSVANAPSLFSPIRPSSPETFQRRRWNRWISPAFFGEARWSAINWSRQVLSTSGHASLGRRRKKRVKSASILLHARGEGGSSFDENCFRPRFDQLFLSNRPLLNSSFNLALPVPFKGQINYFEISISSGKSGKFYEREKYIS